MQISSIGAAAHTDVRLVEVDFSDHAGFAEFHRVLTAGEAADREFATPTALEELRIGFDPDHAEWKATAVVARVDDRVVGAMGVELPLRDNTHLVEVRIAVLPEHRRAGVGRALFERAMAIAGAERRTSLYGEIAEPLRGWSAGPAFAGACGMTRQHVELHQVLDLPVADTAVAELGATAERAESGGYRIVTWRDRCPDRYVAGYCDLLSVFMEHVPLGGLEVEPERWDSERLRAAELRRLAQGRTAYRALAVSPRGEAVGLSEMLAPPPPSLNVHQGSLLVLPEHRGHGLGVAMKLANLRAVQTHQPERRWIHTYNAPENEPVLAINALLGFRPVEQNSEWQRAV